MLRVKAIKGVVELSLACEGAELNQIDVSGQTAPDIAAERGYLDIIGVFLDRKDTDPSRVMSRAKACCTMR